MKNLPFFFTVSLILLLSFYPSFSEAKEYEIPTIKVEVTVNPDGTIRITEHLTYVFDGSYSWANYELAKTASSFIRDIRVTESNNDFINLNTEETGTFLVEESDNSYNIKWFYSAEDEKRTFSVSYTLEGAITIGPEWSEFFWNYASDNRNKSTDNYSIVIQLPETVEKSDLHSWVREPAWAMESFTLDNGFRFSGTEISKNQAVIIRTVFPTSVFNENAISVSDHDFSLAWAKNDEESYRQKQILAQAEEERLINLGVKVIVILVGLSIICFIYFYRKYGSRHRINLSRNESLMIPGTQKPAAIGWLLMHRNVTGGHVTATMLDLARRGYLQLKEEEPKEGLFSPKESEFSIHLADKEIEPNLVNWESDFLNFLKERIESEGHNIKDIFKYSDSKVSKWFREWQSMVNQFGKDRGWIDDTSYLGMYWNLGIQSVLMLCGAVGIFLIHPVVGLSIIWCIIACLLSLVIVRRTPKGEELYQTWKNYHKALKNAKDYSIPDNHLGLHFIYGIAFGLGKSNIEQMFEQNQAAASLITWMVILPGSNNSPTTIASSFSNLAATGTISAGGGATGGGAVAGTAGGGASAGAG